MKLWNMVLILIVAILVSGCLQEPVATEQSNNPNVTVDTLFIKDGCTVYRFMDGGRAVYFVNCNGDAQASTQYTQYCGKNCYRHVEVRAFTPRNRT